ncbi:unnamed protein product [Clonostachys rosea]|uniref:NACHT domain-containing protein n=1 Tax=Bionectria ochroleuca TaxID=29856 RepID=A0ABY6UB65_BIOOC|nr:unnamed protein product [Clonostachys rosea]
MGTVKSFLGKRKRSAKKRGLLGKSGGASERDGQSSEETVIPPAQAARLADTRTPAGIPAGHPSSNATVTSSEDHMADIFTGEETSASAEDRGPSASNGGTATAPKSLWDQALDRLRTSEADPNIIAAVLKFAEQPAGRDSGSVKDSVKHIKRLMEKRIADIETNQKKRAWKIRINKTTYSVRDFVVNTVAVLNKFVSVGGVAVSFDPVHAALPWAAVRFVLINLTAQSKLSSEITLGLAKVTTLVSQCIIYQTLYSASESSMESHDVLRDLKETIVDVYVQSLLFLGFAVQKAKGTHSMAVVKLRDLETHIQNLLDIGEKISRAAENCERVSNHQNRRSVSKLLQLAKDSHSALQAQRAILLDIRKYTLLSTLRHAKGAAYDSHANENDPGCHPDTRVELLEQIQQWVDSDDGEPIFWLQGMAGTGKSTIARTVARDLDESGELGANFFFKRGEGDRSRGAYFFTTISQQLCQRVPSFAEHVQDAIEADPNITDKSMFLQFKELIMQPLKRLSQRENSKSRMTVVVDALDECDLEEDAKHIIELLAKIQNLPGFNLKFFLTSRPEYHIRLGFNKLEVRSHKDVALHTIPEPVVEHDLSVYLVHQLALIRHDYNRMAAEELRLPEDWPPTDEIQKLVNMAVPLFIFAATLCRLLADMAPSNPADELTKILMRPAGTSDEKLTATYCPVLERLVTAKHGSRLPNRQKADVVSRFKKIVGSLILLAEPLSITSLARLLGASRSAVDGIVSSLHSVLRVPRDLNSAVKIFHLSFREFLVDRDGDVPEDFWIDEEKTNEKLGIKCLELLSSDNRLRYDICDLRELAKPKSTVSQEKLDSSLPREAQYACLYWIHHLKEGRAILRDEGQPHMFLRTHFLHWLEALSLMGRLRESIRLTQELQTLVDPNEGIEIMEFLHDAHRFILRFYAIGDQAPLQFYSSALLFAPQRSVIKTTFQRHITWIKQKPITEYDWDPCLQTLESYDASVDIVAFSRDDRSVTSGSAYFPVNIWDTTTGELRHTYDGDRMVESMTFSGDGQLAAFDDGLKVTVLEVATGTVQRTFDNEHTADVETIAFSADDTSMVFGSDDSTVQIWDLATGTLRRSLEAHTGEVTSVACAHNGKLIASGDVDGKVNLWDASTGELQRTLEGRSSNVCEVIFSPDSKLLASKSTNGSIEVLDVESGTLHAPHLGMKGSWRPSMAFSSDGKFLAWGEGKAVVIRSVESGEIHQTFQGHSDNVKHVAYSTSGGLLASASEDDTVKIWDTKIRSSQQRPDSHSDQVCSMEISPDSRLLASGSSDKSVKVWDAASGKLKYTLEGHTRRVSSLLFSPDSTLIASGSNFDSLKLWDTETGNLKQKFEGASIYRVAFSPDSQFFATSMNSSTVMVYDIGNGKQVCFQPSHNSFGLILQFVFSPDSNLLASVDWDHTHVWDVRNRTHLYKFEGPFKELFWMGFSPDSKVLALGFEANNDIKMWDMVSGRLRQVDLGRGLDAFETAFSADGKLLEVTSWDTDEELLVRGELNYNFRTPDLSSTTTLLIRPKSIHKQSIIRAHMSTQDKKKPQPPSRMEIFKSRRYTLNEKKPWIQRDGHDLLWIPPNYRSMIYHSESDSMPVWAGDDSGNRIGIASALGGVLIIAFEP